VRAVNNAGFGPYSTQDNNQARVSLPAGPASVNGFNAVKNGNSVTLNWNNSFNGAGETYQVEADFGTGYNNISNGQGVTQNTLTYQLPISTNATRYNFRIQATNTCGVSTWALTSIDVCQAPGPMNLAVDTNTPCFVNFTWNAPIAACPISSYKFDIATFNGNNQFNANQVFTAWTACANQAQQ
jgi:hypothetical protein